MFSGLESPIHILMLLLLVFLLFGAKRLPEIGRSLGTGMREFKDSATGATKSEPTEVPQLPNTTLDVATPAQPHEETVH